MLGVAVRKLVTLPAQVLGIVCDLLEKFSDPEWVEAAKRFLRKEESWPKPGTIDLGGGFVFKIDEILELEVDNIIEPDEILRRGDQNPADWEYVGKRPEAGTRKVRAAIGWLNKAWTEEKVAELLAKPDCLMKGSGAWVCEAFLKVRPCYDGNGWIGFPDPNSSRWRDRHSERVFFPDLCYDGTDWHRRLHRMRDMWHAEFRLCLLLG